jgi:hypothetical protein
VSDPCELAHKIRVILSTSSPERRSEIDKLFNVNNTRPVGPARHRSFIEGESREIEQVGRFSRTFEAYLKALRIFTCLALLNHIRKWKLWVSQVPRATTDKACATEVWNACPFAASPCRQRKSLEQGIGVGLMGQRGYTRVCLSKISASMGEMSKGQRHSLIGWHLSSLT